MALVVGTNSWATVAEADLYFTDRIGSTGWFDLSETPPNPGEDAKESMLVSAYYWLMGSPDVTLSASLTATNVKNAQIESALYLLEHYDELNARRAAISTGLQDFELSRLTERFNAAYIKIPAYILGLIPEYGNTNTFVQLKGEYDQ